MSLNSPEFQARIANLRAKDIADAERRAKQTAEQMVADSAARARQRMARDAEAALFQEHQAKSLSILSLARDLGQAAVAKGLRSNITLVAQKNWLSTGVPYTGWVLSRTHNIPSDDKDYGDTSGKMLTRDGAMYNYQLYGIYGNTPDIGYHVLHKKVPAGTGSKLAMIGDEYYNQDYEIKSAETMTPITLETLEEDNTSARRKYRTDYYETLLARFALDHQLV